MPKFTDEQKALRRARAQAWNKAHPERVKQNGRLYHAKHKAELTAREPEYRRRNAARLRDKMRVWRARCPWYNIWQGIKQRCNNPRSPVYARYGGRGIKALLSKGDMAFLWARDHAASLVCPSVDRRDNDGDYTLDNCRIISLADNSRKGKGTIAGLMASVWPSDNGLHSET